MVPFVIGSERRAVPLLRSSVWDSGEESPGHIFDPAGPYAVLRNVFFRAFLPLLFLVFSFQLQDARLRKLTLD